MVALNLSGVGCVSLKLYRLVAGIFVNQLFCEPLKLKKKHLLNKLNFFAHFPIARLA